MACVLSAPSEILPSHLALAASSALHARQRFWRSSRYRRRLPYSLQSEFLPNIPSRQQLAVLARLRLSDEAGKYDSPGTARHRGIVRASLGRRRSDDQTLSWHAYSVHPLRSCHRTWHSAAPAHGCKHLIWALRPGRADAARANMIDPEAVCELHAVLASQHQTESCSARVLEVLAATTSFCCQAAHHAWREDAPLCP